MDIFDALYTRQSIGKVKPDPLPRDLIEKLLAAGMQAPNHRDVYPWRFIVIQGDGRKQLGEALAASLKAEKPDLSDAALDAEKAKFYRSPVIIAVGVDKPSNPKVIEIENVCAAAAAAQNILLAAHALGLGAQWRTGAAADSPQVKALLGLAADQHLIALIYVGYPLSEVAPKSRPSFDDRTRWLE